MIARFFSAVRTTWSLPSDAACHASIAHCARSGSPLLQPISAGRSQGSTQYFNPAACAAQTPANASSNTRGQTERFPVFIGYLPYPHQFPPQRPDSQPDHQIDQRNQESQPPPLPLPRSEEHTSELQSLRHLV